MKKVFDMLRMDGKVALITGANQGLGYDIACALAEAGATIVISSRNEEKCKQVAKTIENDYGVKTYTVSFDQRNYDEVEQAVDSIVEKLGRIDVLINNAGGGSGGSEGNLLLRDPEHIKNLIDINGNEYNGDNPKELSDVDTLSKEVKEYIKRLSTAKSTLDSNKTKETFE
jgi:short-subunit dehydrogenase